MAKLKNRKMINDFNILSSDIAYFKLVYEHKSINGAARKIGQDPANISRMIKRLESNLNSKLFIRHKTGLSPTEQGERFYSAISNAQSQFMETLNNHAVSSKRIRIGFSSTIGYAHFSPKMVQGIISLGFVPEFTLGWSAELIEKMKSRELDFALVHNTVKFPGLISRKITTESLVLCSASTELQKTLLLHPDMLELEKIINAVSYKSRWMIKDYFVLSQMLATNKELMGIIPESLLKTRPQLKVLRTFESVGKITALSWPGSVGLELIRWIES